MKDLKRLRANYEKKKLSRLLIIRDKYKQQYLRLNKVVAILKEYNLPVPLEVRTRISESKSIWGLAHSIYWMRTRPIDIYHNLGKEPSWILRLKASLFTT